MYHRLISLYFLLFLSACTPKNNPESYSLTLFVESHGLDYSSTMGFVRSMACSGNFGHAWIRLKGPQGLWEGGHSGELGSSDPTYFQGIMKLIDAGDANPVRYLWSTLHDGYCEKGSGGHIPTCALEVDIGEDKYWAIRELIAHYPFQEYSLSDQQCCTFVMRVAKIVGIDLDATTSIQIDPQIHFLGECLPLWEDPRYSRFEFYSPEALEKSIQNLQRPGILLPGR